MRARELKVQSTDQLQQTKAALEGELLRHVSSVVANAAKARLQRGVRKDLARVLTLLKQKQN